MFNNNLAFFSDFVWESDALLPLISRARFLQGKWVGELRTLASDVQNEIHLKTISGDIICIGKLLGREFEVKQVIQALKSQTDPALPYLSLSERALFVLVVLVNDIMEKEEFETGAAPFMRWYALIKARISDKESGQYIPVGTSPETVIKHLSKWLVTHEEQDALIKAGICFFWLCAGHTNPPEVMVVGFFTVLYFLIQSDECAKRFYSMLPALVSDIKTFRETAALTIAEGNNLTGFLSSFIQCFIQTQAALPVYLSEILYKNAFWERAETLIVNDRQKRVLNELHQKCVSSVSVSDWAKLALCSTDTALRDITMLVKKKILIKSAKGGRSTRYSVNN